MKFDVWTCEFRYFFVSCHLKSEEMEEIGINVSKELSTKGIEEFGDTKTFFNPNTSEQVDNDDLYTKFKVKTFVERFFKSSWY